MESKFTKGPWKLLEIDNRKVIYQFYIKGSDGVSVCKIERANRPDVSTDRANAKAIEALPEFISAALAVMDAQTNKEIEAAKGLCFAALNKALD